MTSTVEPAVESPPPAAPPTTRGDALAAAIRAALPPEAARSAARSIAWQCRKGLYPVAAGASLWTAAYTMHDTAASPVYVLGGTAAIAAVGVAVKKVRCWLSKALWRPVWGGSALAAAAAWTATAVHAGAGLNTPTPTILVVGGALVSAPWWWVNRPTPATAYIPPPRVEIAGPAATAVPQQDEDEPHPHQAAWTAHVGHRTLAGSTLASPEQIFDHAGRENGTAWTIDGGAKKHTYPDMRNAINEIKATLDRPDVDNLIYLEQDHDGWKTRGRLVVLERNPLVQEVLWKGARLDPATGLVPMSIYPDGTGWAYYVLYRPGWGTPHDLLAGCTGSGKSTALRLIVGESLLAGSCVMLFDPHGGGSFKEALPKVTRPFLDEHQIYAGMRGLAAAQDERLCILREVGEENMGPDHGHPILHAVIDEASKPIVLGNPDINRIILGGVQEGRKLWMKYTLAMQRPSVDAFDDNSDAREQLLSGNVIIYRVATSQTSRMANAAGLDIEPHTLPASFDRDGKIPTTGLGFVLGANRREMVSRTINATQEAFTRYVPAGQPLDERTAEAFERGYAEGMADIAMAAAEADQPQAKAPAKMATVTPITTNDVRAKDQALALFRRHGQLKPAQLADAGICPLSNAYRVCEALESEGLVTRTGEGVYALKVS